MADTALILRRGADNQLVNIVWSDCEGSTFPNSDTFYQDALIFNNKTYTDDEDLAFTCGQLFQTDESRLQPWAPDLALRSRIKAVHSE